MPAINGRLTSASTLTLAFILGASVLTAQRAEAASSPSPSWTATESGSAPSAWPVAPQAYAGVAVGDLFHDGRKEVVAGFPDGNVNAWFASNGAQVPGWPQSGGGGPVHSSPTLVDLTGSGQLDVIATSESGQVNVWNPSGVALSGWPQRSHPAAQNYAPGFFSSVAVGDIRGDGGKYLVASSFDHTVYAWNSVGTIVPGFPINLYDTAWDTPTLVDLEHIGRLDIVVGSDSSGGSTEPYPAGGVYWAFRGDGSRVTGWPKTTDQTAWASTAADDLNADGNHDIVAGSGHFYAAPAGQQVNVWQQNGAPLSGWPQATGGRNFASPAVGDLLGDGRREVVQNSEDGQVYIWQPNGSALSGWPLNPSQGQLLSSPAIAPVDSSGKNGVWVAAGVHLFGYNASGGLVFDSGQLPGIAYGAPTIADLGTGQLSVVEISQSDLSSPGSEGSWQVRAYPISGSSTTLPSGAWPTFHGNMLRSGTNLAMSPAPPGPQPPPLGSHAYWLSASDGGVFAFGTAPFYGSTGNIKLAKPVVAIARTPSGAGYWEVANDGGLFAFGNAGFYGSTGAMTLSQPVVSMAPTPDGGGYWLVAADGGIFAFGDAGFYGSMGGKPLTKPIVGITPSPTGHGYRMVASDGGIFAFGDALFFGSMGGQPLSKPMVAMAATPDGGGYWQIASDGGVFAFGDAGYYGSTGAITLAQPVTGMAATASGHGYYMVASDGGMFSFGDAPFLGSMGGQPLAKPVVSMTEFG